MALANTPITNGSFLEFAQPSPGFGGSANQYVASLGFYTAVCNGSSSVTVADAGVTAQSIIIFTLQTVGGTVGALPAIQTITPGTGFTFKGTASDTSTYQILRIG